MKKLFSMTIPGAFVFAALSALSVSPAWANEEAGNTEAQRTVAATAPTVLYEEDPTLLTTTIQVVLLSGAADDPTSKSGLTNLLSELMVRGTKSRNRSAFQNEVERLGATLQVRASHDMVVFGGEVIKENTQKFLELIEDCILRPALNAKEFASLKTEMLAAITHVKNNNGRLSGLALRRELLAGTSLERPANGGVSSVKGLTLKDMQDAYKRIFVRGNLVFGIATPLKEAELKAPITAIWTGLADGPRITRKSIAPQTPKEPTLVVVHKPKTSTGSLMFGQGGITIQDKYRYTLGVGNFSFGAEPLVSRLFRVVRSELGWTYSVGSTYGAMGGLSSQQGFFVITSTPSIEFTSKTALKILDMWREYLKAGLKSDELDLAHDSMVNSYPFEFDSANKRLSQKLYSYVYGVPVLSQNDFKNTIDDIGNSEIKKALKERQSENGWLITLVADADEIAKQLEAEQKDIPAEKRLKIAKRLTPDQVID